MGSSQGPVIGMQESIRLAERLGGIIAQKNCVLVNGACPGLPNDAARGAKKEGGFVLGVSPAFSKKAHVEKYLSPTADYDILLFTGLGLMERDIINIRSSDAVIVVGGGVGTLNEFIVAFDEGKIVGVLTGTGGIADHIDEILTFAHRERDRNIVLESDPEILVNKILEKIKNGDHAVVEDQRVISKDFNPFA